MKQTLVYYNRQCFRSSLWALDSNFTIYKCIPK